MSREISAVEPEPFSGEDVSAQQAPDGAAAAGRDADAANDGCLRNEARLLTPAVLRVLEWHRQRAQARARDGS
jgi:hypothetical protein